MLRGMPPLGRGPREEVIMKKQIRKITLAKETLRNLAGPEVAAVQGEGGGGIYPNTLFNSCHCPTLSCKAGQC
jgi:hypothetical protein